MTTRRAEVLIVGGGPAGLATAIACRQRGLEVDVLDRRRPPIDKPCGEGLMPSGLRTLGELGVDPDSLPGVTFEGVRYIDGDVVAEGRFADGPGRGIRRTALHDALARRTLELGARCHWGVVAERLLSCADAGCEVASSAGTWRCRWLVGADGLHSRSRGWLGLERPPARWQRFGVRRHFRCKPWSSFVEVYWRGGCEAYVTPVADDLVGVAILWHGGKSSFDELFAGFEVLRGRLQGAEIATKGQGAGPFRQRVRRRVRGAAALVGDAGGYVDALTGEGLGLGAQQALALAGALDAGDLAIYEKASRQIVHAPEMLTKVTLLLSRLPRLRPRTVRVLARHPALFSRLLSIQNHERDLWPAGALDLVELAGRMVLPGHAVRDV